MAGSAANLVDACMGRSECPDACGLAAALPGRVAKPGVVRLRLRHSGRGDDDKRSQANAYRHASPRD